MSSLITRWIVSLETSNSRARSRCVGSGLLSGYVPSAKRECSASETRWNSLPPPSPDRSAMPHAPPHPTPHPLARSTRNTGSSELTTTAAPASFRSFAFRSLRA